MWLIPYLWRLVFWLAMVTLVIIIEEHTLPRFQWYCALRTWLYRYLPYEGAKVGVVYYDKRHPKPGLVVGTNIRRREVLVEMYWEMRGRVEGSIAVAVRQTEWVRTRSLIWLPDWTELTVSTKLSVVPGVEEVGAVDTHA